MFRGADLCWVTCSQADVSHVTEERHRSYLRASFLEVLGIAPIARRLRDDAHKHVRAREGVGWLDNGLIGPRRPNCYQGQLALWCKILGNSIVVLTLSCLIKTLCGIFHTLWLPQSEQCPKDQAAPAIGNLVANIFKWWITGGPVVSNRAYIYQLQKNNHKPLALFVIHIQTVKGPLRRLGLGCVNSPPRPAARMRNHTT